MADQINAVLAQRTAPGGGKYTDFVPASEAGLGTVFGPGTLDAPGIQAAINLANLAGGGTVQLPAGIISLSAPLDYTGINSVRLKGVPPKLIYNTIPDSGLTTLTGTTGGTVLAPTGAFAAITWNTASLGVPASQTAFSQAGLTNLAFEDLGFNGGTYGIFAGGTNNPSAWYSQFKNLYFTGQTVVGLSLTNYQHCWFDANYSFGCQWGQLHQIDVASASLAPGNSVYKDLYCASPSGAQGNLARSITFLTTATTGGAANNNEFKFDRMQSNRFGSTNVTQAATMANTSANITVTDGTKFAVGIPVTFSVTANGFTVNLIYFVVSVAANVLTVASTYGGAAITATGSTAINITTTGFPCFEMIALSGSSNTNVTMDNTDVEGGGTCAMLFQNVTGLILSANQWPSGAQSPISICGRSLINATIFSPQDASTDFDGNASSRNIQFFGRRSSTASVQYMGAGVWYDNLSGKTVFSLGYQSDTQGAGILTFDPATAGGLVSTKNAGIGQFTKNINSASFTVTNLNAVYSNGTSAAANTLPTVNANNAGSWVRFINHTAGTQTIATDGTQLFNGIAGRTVITLNSGATVDLSAVQTTTGPAYTWDVVGGTSAMAAGVISAPT